MMHGRIMRLSAAGLMITAVAGACGDDDDDAGGDSAEYCEASLALEIAPDPDIDFETASEEEIQEALKTFVSDTFLPLAETARGAADEAVVADIDIAIDALKEIGDTGDFAAFEDPEVEAALDRLHAYDLETCDWNAVEVAGVDYAYEGVPAEIDAGVTSFEFTNKGSEIHEMVVFRINDGVTETVEELLALPEEEVETKVTEVAGIGALPGGDEFEISDLEPGNYAMLCFVPVGSTGEDVEGTGPPHFTEGMVAEFTVT